jgi:dienelactone hydrolase
VVVALDQDFIASTTYTMAQVRRLMTIDRGLCSSPAAQIVDSDACVAMGNTIPPGPKGRGSVETVGDMSMYVVGKGPRAIVLVYDIMGFAPANTQHNCDVLANAGFLVVMPDFFRGSGRGQEGFERPDSDVVDAELANVVLPFVKSKGGKSIGLVGFCFGGGVAARAASTGLLACVGGIHASGLTPELAAKTKVPMMMLQAGNDPDLAPVVEALKGTDVYDKCVTRQVRKDCLSLCSVGEHCGSHRHRMPALAEL